MESHPGVESFKVIVRGGKWTHSNMGRAYDAVAAKSNSQKAREFCSLFQLPQMQSFATRRYGDNLSTQLAGQWASKMTFLFNHWINELQQQPVGFPDASVLVYEEEQGLAEILGQLRSCGQTDIRLSPHAKQRLLLLQFGSADICPQWVEITAINPPCHKPVFSVSKQRNYQNHPKKNKKKTKKKGKMHGIPAVSFRSL